MQNKLTVAIIIFVIVAITIFVGCENTTATKSFGSRELQGITIERSWSTGGGWSPEYAYIRCDGVVEIGTKPKYISITIIPTGEPMPPIVCEGNRDHVNISLRADEVWKIIYQEIDFASKQPKTPRLQGWKALEKAGIYGDSSYRHLPPLNDGVPEIFSPDDAPTTASADVCE